MQNPFSKLIEGIKMQNPFLFEAEGLGYESQFEDSSELYEDEYEDEDANEYEDEDEVRRRRGGRFSARPSKFRPRPLPPKRPRPRRPKYPLPHSSSRFDFTSDVAQPAQESSECVRLVQSLLNRVLGMNLPVDGVMNVETRSAIRSFQSQKDLSADGVGGSPTDRAPIEDGANQPGDDTDKGQEEYDVFEFYDSEAEYFELEEEVNRQSVDYAKWIQQSLNRIMGLQLTVDGIVGAQTRSAIRSFQQKQGLTADGVVGPITEGALIRAGASSPPQSSGTSPAPFINSPTSAPTPSVNLASKPCPVHSPGRTTDRCKTSHECPAIPNLLCVTVVNNIPFEYVAGRDMIRRNSTTRLYEVVSRMANRQEKFIPSVGQALGAFLTNMTRFGMPVEAILTAGSLYCRCITGTDTLSNHSFGDAIDVVGIRWRSPNGSRETIVHNYQNPADRAILRRINACLRLSFSTTIDYYNSYHRDHFHCDMNRGGGRILHGGSTVAFVQEALNTVAGQRLVENGKLDNPTKQALSTFSGRSVQELANNTIYSRVLDDLFARVARG